MGYDAKVFLVYGIPFSYGPDTEDKLDWLLELVVPDIVEKYGEDVWCCFDTLPHECGYYLLDFTEDGKLMLCCWWTSHSVVRSREPPKLVDMPTEHKKERFLAWCTHHNINTEKAGFYTIISDG